MTPAGFAVAGARNCRRRGWGAIGPDAWGGGGTFFVQPRAMGRNFCKRSAFSVRRAGRARKLKAERRTRIVRSRSSFMVSSSFAGRLGRSFLRATRRLYSRRPVFLGRESRSDSRGRNRLDRAFGRLRWASRTMCAVVALFFKTSMRVAHRSARSTLKVPPRRRAECGVKRFQATSAAWDSQLFKNTVVTGWKMGSTL